MVSERHRAWGETSPLCSPNAGSWGTVLPVPWSPSHNNGESRWMQCTKGMVEAAESSMDMDLAPGQGEGVQTPDLRALA